MTKNKLFTQTKMSEKVGWSEGNGRRWIKAFKDYIPFEKVNNKKMYNNESIRILSFLKDFREMGLSMNEIKKWVKDNGMPENETETKQVLHENKFENISNEYSKDIAKTIPTIKELLIPYLDELRDGNTYSANELTQKIVKVFNLSESQRIMKYETNTDTIFLSRIRGARYSLKKEGYIIEVNKFSYQITAEGLELLEENVFDIAVEVEEMEKLVDPLTAIKENVNDLHNQLADELLNELMRLDWKKFEDIVIDLLTTMGYGDGEVTDRTNDEGLDGIIKEDKLGLDNIYVQAKRYGIGNSVGRAAVQGFSGALDGKGARKGVFITTSYFTNGAKEYAKKVDSKSIILIDGKELASLMISYNVGVDIKTTFVVKELNYNYFKEE
ncbi:restriction endonuclease [Sporosarcina siberiensis]|uniref:Restriction endonuclease n=1 Tax=Sporosarcina siberiensis TaxID=1365606 RepID=A0ABW4SD80_9BACL